MASLEFDPVAKRFRIRFRYNGGTYKRSLKTANPKDAQAVVERVEETIRLLERGRLEMPSNADPATFILSDGKRISATDESSKARTLGSLCKTYRDSLPPGAKEATTLKAEDRHIKHLKRHLGTNCIVQNVTLNQMQGYVGQRLAESWRRKPIGPETIQRELSTFRYVWHWGVRHGHLKGICPIKGISLPKTDEQPPFMAWEEIAGAINRGSLTKRQEQELWDCLFLRTSEIGELLEHVRTTASYPFIYPLIAIAAYTGARRSELLRSEVDDFDFRSGTVLLREKKKSRKKAITFRRVPMTDNLADIMKSWFTIHPGSRMTFPISVLPQIEAKRPHSASITGDHAAYHFNSALLGTKWEHVHGYHVFRHSFASNCAAAGVDQRVIDEWMGHQTDEMRRRYRHLFPEQQRTAIELVFGRNGQ